MIGGPLGGGPLGGRAGGSGGTTIDVGGSEHIQFVGASAIAATNMPAAIDDVFSQTPGAAINRRIPAYLIGRTEARIYGGGGVAAATSTIAVQYSLDGGTNWDYLDGDAGPSITLAGFTGATSTTSSGWVTIAEAARADVLLRIAAVGNGVADPTIGNLGIEVR